MRRTSATALLGGVLLLTGCSAGVASTPTATTAGAAFHGQEPPGELPERPSFVLTDTDGESFDFADETSGRPTLLYFGYTNCPDECPTAMADIAGALRVAEPEVAGKTRVVFVTTDPDRDSGAVLRRWLDKFDTDYVGLTGTQAEVDAAQEAVGVAPAAKGGPVPTLPGRPDEHVHAEGTAPHTHDGPLGYGVGHADVIFAYDTEDRLPVMYPGGTRPSDLAADLPLLVPGDAP
ncbi:MAG: Cytochrome oxidase biogenesis protein Sco1/SenC/PrrC, thiol-disulfide reductase involved in Cu(I) insertion into CoxII Cu(A) center [uncultured Actinomycetospora sp.]|uniref:Cytochrome oxidase biogenesis protein Sco1/SenC/PrrC, thiol-disulfide reductase involved in Cu(I) insertion into CoxII Cu(A) center n=1 Tax=uncultured Actinomycetospora sp. TaxID=1135996 RepID=A0A6J4K596_9PSEU|nr:MAG: Cytochrome oxidase biogenesis protein Sco1/SenC/PrrC, thiol-disulfide reductase involved in Cu(I) insertion into CoxII Cu(A) center [uncultured Actinomycetospora sp.]